MGGFWGEVFFVFFFLLDVLSLIFIYFWVPQEVEHPSGQRWAELKPAVCLSAGVTQVFPTQPVPKGRGLLESLCC